MLGVGNRPVHFAASSGSVSCLEALANVVDGFKSAIPSRVASLSDFYVPFSGGSEGMLQALSAAGVQVNSATAQQVVHQSHDMKHAASEATEVMGMSTKPSPSGVPLETTPSMTKTCVDAAVPSASEA